MALTASSSAPALGAGPIPETLCLAQKGSTTCYPGGIAVLGTDGYVKPGVTGLDLVAVGFFDFMGASSVNSGSDGDVTVAVRPGTRLMANSAGGDAVTQAHVGQLAFIVDDATVACRSAGTRSPAGRIVSVSSAGVYVTVGMSSAPSSLAGIGIQKGTGTLAAGVLTVNTGITLTSSSVIVANHRTGAGTQGDSIRVPTADRTAGAPGTASVTFRSFLNGSAATSDTSTFDYVIIG